MAIRATKGMKPSAYGLIGIDLPSKTSLLSLSKANSILFVQLLTQSFVQGT